jgi:predicted ATP-binding protein involved in virulence
LKFKSVHITNYRSIQNLSLGFGSRLTLLLGENGSGKTAVLDASAVGLGAVFTHLPTVKGISFKKSDLMIQSGNKNPFMRVGIETSFGLVWDRTESSVKDVERFGLPIPKAAGLKSLRQYLDEHIVEPYVYGNTFELPVFAYYGVSRALTDIPRSRKGFSKEFRRFSAYDNALEATNRFKTAFSWFHYKENEEHRLQKEQKSFEASLPELDAVRNAIQTIFSDVSNPRTLLNPLRFVVTKNGEDLELSQLSDGYKTLLGLVMDLAMRMAIANPEGLNVLQSPAFVMIDEVDLHLHPTWQYRVINDLLRTFPNTQFVITTHSPFIAESINNYLQRDIINRYPASNRVDSTIEKLLPLNAESCKAYLMQNGEAENLFDEDVGLLKDHLMQTYNQINRDYERMRDIEWDNRTA